MSKRRLKNIFCLLRVKTQDIFLTSFVRYECLKDLWETSCVYSEFLFTSFRHPWISKVRKSCYVYYKGVEEELDNPVSTKTPTAECWPRYIPVQYDCDVLLLSWNDVNDFSPYVTLLLLLTSIVNDVVIFCVVTALDTNGVGWLWYRGEDVVNGVLLVAFVASKVLL